MSKSDNFLVDGQNYLLRELLARGNMLRNNQILISYLLIKEMLLLIEQDLKEFFVSDSSNVLSRHL